MYEIWYELRIRASMPKELREDILFELNAIADMYIGDGASFEKDTRRYKGRRITYSVDSRKYKTSRNAEEDAEEILDEVGEVLEYYDVGSSAGFRAGIFNLRTQRIKNMLFLS